MSNALKLLAIVAIAALAFCGGVTYERALKNAEIAQLKQSYSEANERAQKQLVEDFNEKQKELESALYDARNRESDARNESQQLQQRLKQLSRNAKTADAQLAIRSIETARRCQEIVSRDTTIIEYCRAALR